MTSHLCHRYSEAMMERQDPGLAQTPGQSGYVIHILGKLDDRWSDWFQDIEIVGGEYDGKKVTILTCPSTDQAQLRGILIKVWDLNMKVLSVKEIAQADNKA